ncbi:MAG: malonyl-CoA decarboxylase [Polaromonas sp.]|nr:malonyl-CoA decarboxylase [Polaromonas sp.]
MSAQDWLNRSVSRFTAAEKSVLKMATEAAERAQGASKNGASATAGRSTHERLQATLPRKPEALSPRALRRILTELQAIVDPQVSEVEGGRRAREFADWYASPPTEQRHDVWLLISEQFGPEIEKVAAAREQYEAAMGTAEEGQAEISLRRAFVSPRTRLLQRFSAFPEGMQFLVDMRAELLPYLKSDKRLLALDAELENLFSTWFDVAFLELRRISWDSPASMVEKLIKYEAVHAIKGWADVKNRLDSDRRCYGFFHARLPDVPLIFVEVALGVEIASEIMPLLDELGPPSDLKKATTAICYSISNTQGGLRGVSFGDSLIKRVVEALKEEFPKLKTFATLSPIPGFRSWLGKNAVAMLEKLGDKKRLALGHAIGVELPNAGDFLAAAEGALALPEKSPVRLMLLQCAAHYLGQVQQEGKPIDPVARFHLGNGARIERLNWAGDPSPKGLKQSYGMMVNYLYDLTRLDKHRALLARGKMPASGSIEDLYL